MAHRKVPVLLLSWCKLVCGWKDTCHVFRSNLPHPFDNKVDGSYTGIFKIRIQISAEDYSQPQLSQT